MKTEKTNVSGLTTRLMVMLPLFLLLMGLGIGCDDGLMLNEDKNVSPDLNTSADALASGSSLPHTNVTSLEMPVSVAYELTTYDCSNNPGPQITFSGLAST